LVVVVVMEMVRTFTPSGALVDADIKEDASHFIGNILAGGKRFYCVQLAMVCKA